MKTTFGNLAFAAAGLTARNSSGRPVNLWYIAVRTCVWHINDFYRELRQLWSVLSAF